jgi:BlaI family transcriptional regulator, penicillinase repressor
MQITPTDSELEILQILWQQGAQTVRFVNDEQNKQREVGYTTTLKIMQIMLDKGLLSRDIVERSHIYKAAAQEEATQSQLLRTFMDNAFRGDAASLVLRALGNGDTSVEELQKIKDLIAQIEKENNL